MSHQLPWNVSQRGLVGLSFLEQQEGWWRWGLWGTSRPSFVRHSPDFKQRLNTVYYFKNFILLDNKRKATNQSENHKLKFVRHRGGCCSWTHRPLTLSGFRFLRIPNAACPKAFGKSLDSILHILPFLPNFTCWGSGNSFGGQKPVPMYFSCLLDSSRVV